jgi:ABC-type transport system involved in multi-copper enzyme maturation permease subunit
MKSLVNFEVRKLLHDKEFLIAVALVIAYMLYAFTLLDRPDNDSFAGWFDSRTRDSVFMVFFIGLVSASIFSSDYAYKTYKNVVPYVGMRRVFFSKVMTNVILIFAVLLLWYFLAFVFSIIRSGETAFADSMMPLLFRFVTQYLLVLFHSGILLLVASITRQRGVTSVFTVLGWVAYAFVPVSGKPFYEHVVATYLWGVVPDIHLSLFFVGSFLLCCVASAILSERREVLV